MLLSDEEEQEPLRATVTNGDTTNIDNTAIYSQGTNSSNYIKELADSQEACTKQLLPRIFQFLRLQVLRQSNALEEYVMQHEANDCSLVSKYKQVVTIDMSHDSSVSVDKVILSGLHIPHPLVSFMSNENNQNAPTSIDLPKELHESPIIVFIHGLGGQISQFEPLMGLLSQALEIMAIDLPGFGNSCLAFDHKGKLITEFTQDERDSISLSIKAMSWTDFETDNIVTIVLEYIRQYISLDKTIILVGHSMGTHISTKVASRLPQSKVEGLILLSPPEFHDDVSETNLGGVVVQPAHRFAFFTYFPWLFNVFRTWDRLPGLSSASVQRQLTKENNSNFYIKLRQFRWNMDVDSEIVLKYIYGFSKARCSELITAISKFNDRVQDKRVYEKTLFVGGEEDLMTPVRHIDEVVSILESKFGKKVTHSIKIPNVGHSLLLSKPEFISGVILNHVESKFPERLHLSPAWVLKVKAEISGDKWGLKNEQKWSKIKLLSANITRRNGTERAPLLGMKTLREGDVNHSPSALEARFYGDHHHDSDNNYDKPKGKLIAVVDISADIPPYSPKSFEHIKYYKCATVSKVVPDAQAARRFIQLIDDIFASTNEPDPLIVVHCHYGFNRTGFLICCYLIEKLGWSVPEAIDGFKEAKPPGIKHQHFIDELYVRYENK